MERSETAKRYGPDFRGAALDDPELREAMLSWAILNHASLRWASMLSLWVDPIELNKGEPQDGHTLAENEKQAQSLANATVSDQ